MFRKCENHYCGIATAANPNIFALNVSQNKTQELSHVSADRHTSEWPNSATRRMEPARPATKPRAKDKGSIQRGSAGEQTSNSISSNARDTSCLCSLVMTIHQKSSFVSAIGPVLGLVAY